MTAQIPLVQSALAACLAVAAIFVARRPTAASARSAAVGASASAVALLVAIALVSAGSALDADHARDGALAPLVVALIGLLACALAPIDTHAPRAMAAVVGSTSLAIGSVVAPSVLVTAVAVVAGPWLAWCAVARTAGSLRSRVCAAYLVPMSVLVVSGASLVALGEPSAIAASLVGAGLAIRAGMVPAQTWVPALVDHAPAGVSVALLGSTLAILPSVLGTLAPGGGPLPDACVAVGAITALLGGGAALAARSPRRLLGYLFVTQAGLVAMCAAAPAEIPTASLELTWASIGLSTSAFGMCLAAIESRRGVASLLRPTGVFAQTPRLAAACLVAGLAAVGAPISAVFVGLDRIVEETAASSWLAASCALVGSTLAAIAVVRAAFVMFGGARGDHATAALDLSHRESWALAASFAFLLGTTWLHY